MRRFLAGVFVVGFSTVSISCPAQVPGAANSRGACRNLPVVTSQPFIRQGGEVTYCVGGRASLPSLRTQLLIDASGSMAGFVRALPQLEQWVRQAFSYAQGRVFTPAGERACYFALGRGMFGCSAGVRLGPFAARGDTNLHEAIRAAPNADVTVILTDGVSATGIRAAGDCAAGVDAACVARALQDAVRPKPGEAQDRQAGIWVVPLAALYDGTFFTEEFIQPAQFHSSVAAENVRRETATVANIGTAAMDASGRLEFPYHGPRALMLLVIARPVEAGRGLLQALAERTAYAQVQAVSGLKEFQSGVAVFPAVEIFPGYVPPITWAGYPVVPAPRGVAQRCGTLDSRWTAPSTLRLDCPPGGDNEAVFQMRGQAPRGPAGCVRLRVLPDMKVEPRADARNFSPLRGARWDEKGESLTMRVACNATWPFSCGSSPYRVDWIGLPDFGNAANCLASPACKGEAASAIRAISTDRAAEFPHRIYGLQDTIARFYANPPAVNYVVPVAELNICRGL